MNTVTWMFAVVFWVTPAIAQQPGALFEYQGFNMIAFNKGDYAEGILVHRSLDYIVSTGSNFVNIDWMVAFDDDGAMVPQESSLSHEPPQSDVRRLVQLARQRGLRVFLKPHAGFPPRTVLNGHR